MLRSEIGFRIFLVGLAASTLLGVSTRSQADEEQLEYNRDVRPILADNCFACHGADSASRKADLRLDVREAATEYGAITEGKPDESEVIARVFSEDPDLVMPPAATKKTLTEEEKRILKRWIAEGAEYQPHWSLIAPVDPELPAVQNENWVTNPIDRFVLAKLEEAGLSPAPEADPRTLYRRLRLDLTGLPPEPDEIARFEQDYQQRGDAALSEAIDRLMKSTAWGEHRARYWLDAARYADTHGLHFDNYREMWPYRDWVIRSFNSNQPFDEFTVEQIAGDLLPDPTDEQLIATGFQRCNITTNEGGTIDEENLALYASDRVQTFGWVYLGLTANCAQCHDHKFDAFSQKDYYSLAAFFRNTTQGPKDGNAKDGRGPILVLPSEDDQARWEALPDLIATAKTERDAHRQSIRPTFESWVASVSPESLSDDLTVDELLVHLQLNEGNGNPIQSSVGDAETIETPEELEWADDGKLGFAPVFHKEKTLDLGDLGDFERDQSFSYGAWVRSPGKNLSAAIIARLDEQANYRGWDLWQNGGSYSVHIIDSWDGNAIKVTTRKAVVKPGKWQHVMMTYNGSGKANGVKIYVDGKNEPLKVDKDTLKEDATIRVDTPLRIGQRNGSAVFEGGSVQDVRIYDRRLAAGEVKAIADNASLQEILKIAEKDRTTQQKDALFNYYLATQDEQYPTLAKTVTDLEAEQEDIRTRSPVTHIQQEKMDSPAMAHVLMRGEYDRPGEEVMAATPSALHPLADALPRNRLGLAKWILDPANPLTARVTVNRFWQQVFGQGIVVTPEDFGVMGALPTHPELLDWLAIDFRENGWDVQRFFKQVLMSSTYRQAAITTDEKLEKDRHNALLSRGPRYRMDAEMIRDCMLASSGLLSEKMYGPGTRPYQPENIWEIVGLPNSNTRTYKQDSGEDLHRRTIYNFWKRMAPPPSLEALNAPSREFCTVKRERTNTPLQALVTLNDPQFVEAARHLAQECMIDADSDKEIINSMAVRVLGRSFSKEEQSVLLSDYSKFLAYYESKPKDAEALTSVGETDAPQNLDRVKLATWTLVANQVMNLDEALNK